jgi:hypothetical protein
MKGSFCDAGSVSAARSMSFGGAGLFDVGGCAGSKGAERGVTRGWDLVVKWAAMADCPVCLCLSCWNS